MTFSSPGASNSTSPIVMMSEKFAANCQKASPFSLTDPSWYLDSGAIDHVVAA